MRTFIDIGHPAHVHYFRNFISIMKSRGHQFFISARDKEVVHNLLRANNLYFTNRGKGKKSLIGKFFYLFIGVYLLLKYSLQFRPDIFLSFGSPYAAVVSKLLNKVHIAFDDTEHAKLAKIYAPFTDVILSPSCFFPPFSRKQIFFDSYMEMCYLHPKYFTPRHDLLSCLGLTGDKRYVVLRFVSWNANHDFGLHGMLNETKRQLISELSNYARVFISSESSLPADLEPYRIIIPPEKLHHVLAYAALCISEGSTTASECTILGTPNIYVNSLKVGTNLEQEHYKLSYCFDNHEGVLQKAVELLGNEDKIADLSNKHRSMLSEKISPTDLMVWFIENYPESAKIMRANPDYQYRFRSL